MPVLHDDVVCAGVSKNVRIASVVSSTSCLGLVMDCAAAVEPDKELGHGFVGRIGFSDAAFSSEKLCITNEYSLPDRLVASRARGSNILQRPHFRTRSYAFQSFNCCGVNSVIFFWLSQV